MKLNAMVIYHANCVDGFGAAWAFHHLVAKDYESVSYTACDYNDPIPVFAFGGEDTHLFILDFSFPREVLEVYAKQFLQVHLYDHHKTAIDALSNWQDKPMNLRLVLNNDHSGAMITWNELADYAKVKFPSKLIAYIEDRDLWEFNLWKSKAVNAYIALADKTFESYTELDRMFREQMIFVGEAGELLMRQHQKFCEEIANEARPCTIENSTGSIYFGLVSNCTGQFASEVGNILAKRSGTYGATYFQSASGDVKWSLRSIGDFDTTSLSKTYGGGGHKNASGFVLTSPPTDGAPEGVTLWNNF